jgi:hypothetical protein
VLVSKQTKPKCFTDMNNPNEMLSVTINYYGQIGYMLCSFGTYASRHVNHNVAAVRDDVEVDRRLV